MSELRKPHESVTRRGEQKVIRHNVTVTISQGDHPRVVLQNGSAFEESGRELEVIPDHVWEAYSKMSPEMQEALGLKKPEPTVKITK